MSNDSEDEFEIGGAGGGALAPRTNSRENSSLGVGGAVTALPPGTKVTFRCV